MSTTNYLVRILGGQSMILTYDSVAGTVTLLAQSVTLSSLSAALQAQFSAAIASGSGANPSSGNMQGLAARGGDMVSQAIGAILDSSPVWRTAVLQALANLSQDVFAGE